MEIGHFSFLTSILSRLYHLIIWYGGFNSRPGPVCCGMGRISLWAEPLYWVCPSNPFIKRSFRLAFWAYSGLIHILF